MDYIRKKDAMVAATAANFKGLKNGIISVQETINEAFDLSKKDSMTKDEIMDVINMLLNEVDAVIHSKPEYEEAVNRVGI